MLNRKKTDTIPKSLFATINTRACVQGVLEINDSTHSSQQIIRQEYLAKNV